MSLRPAARWTETILLLVITAIAFLGLALVSLAAGLRQGLEARALILAAVWPGAALVLPLWALHGLLIARGVRQEQLVLPCVGLLAALGLSLLWRLLPPALVWQQLVRGWWPGLALVGAMAAWPSLLERVRRDWPMTVSALGLGLLLATALFGQVDEAGARLSLRLGPLPPVQTSEPVKLALIIFLAWYIDREGAAVEGWARPLGWFRVPSLRYFVPGTLYVALATLALFRMSDLGAVLILGALFVTMLYAGLETRVFLPVALIGLGLALVVGLLVTWAVGVPGTVQMRWAAFANPWSHAPLIVNGQDTGLTVAAGPGYQIQQALYAVMAGGVSGTGLGFGLPGNVPLAHSDFIFASVVEELGAAGGLAVLAIYAVLFVRILRAAALLPPRQTFERLLLVGIGVHLFFQVFVMVGGTLNLLPVTGLTVPFMSHGGVAMLVNVVEAGVVLALAGRVEPAPAGAAPA